MRGALLLASTGLSAILSLAHCTPPSIQSNEGRTIEERIVQELPVEPQTPLPIIAEPRIIFNDLINALEHHEYERGKIAADEAVREAYDQSWKEFSQWAQMRCALGELSQWDGMTRYQLAESTLEKASRELGKKTPESIKRASLYLETAVEIYPLNHSLHSDLAICYDILGEPEKARRSLVHVVDLWPLGEGNTYERLAKAYLKARKLHTLTHIAEELTCADPTLVLQRLLDETDELLRSGVSITHDASQEELVKGFGELFDALGRRMLERDKCPAALTYFSLAATNKIVAGMPAREAKHYLEEQYNTANARREGQLRPLEELYLQAMQDFDVPREEELVRALRER